MKKNFVLVSGSHSGLPLSSLMFLLDCLSLFRHLPYIKEEKYFSPSGAVPGSSIWISIINYQSPFCFKEFLSSEPSRISPFYIARNPDLSNTHTTMSSSACLHIHVFNWPHIYKTWPQIFATCLAFFLHWILHQQIQPPYLLKVSHLAYSEWSLFLSVTSHLTNHISSSSDKLSSHVIYVQSPGECPFLHSYCLSLTSEQT